MVYYYHQKGCNISDNLMRGNSFFFIPSTYVPWTGWEDGFIYSHFREMSGLSLLEYFRSIGSEETKKILVSERLNDSRRRQDDLLRASLHFAWDKVKYGKDSPSFKDFTLKYLAQKRAAFVDMAEDNLKNIKYAEALYQKKKDSDFYYLKM